MSTSSTSRGRTARTALRLLACAFLALPAWATAQQDCQYGTGTRSFQMTTLPGGGRIVYLSSPHLVCADGVEIWADSAVSYSQLGYSDLTGHVRYTDRQRILRADRARYFNQQARLTAHGSVFVEDTVQGSTIRDGDLIYLRRSKERKQEEVWVSTGPDGVRPHATLYMRPTADTVASEPPADTSASARVPPPPSDTVRRPYDVVADRIFLQGDQYFRATGRVLIDRDSLHAHSDSAEYDQNAGRLLLEGRAQVENASYDLRARRIHLGIPGGAIHDVRAIGQAVLVGRDVRLTAPLIHMFLQDGVLDRLVATPLRSSSARSDSSGVAPSLGHDFAGVAPPPRRELAGVGAPSRRDSAGVAAPDTADAARPVAVAEEYHLTADSIEVNAPDQVLQRIFAEGDARGQSDARDSLNVDSLPAVARKDWVEGDTVIVTFVPVPPDTAADTLPPPPPPPPGQDTAKARYRVDRLVAAGNARSLYRLLPSDSTARPGIDPPAVHYATGSRITIVMKEGEVDHMDVDGPAKGWHLEPDEQHAADTVAGSDSLGHRPDSLSHRPDSLGHRSNAGRARADTVRADTSVAERSAAGATPVVPAWTSPTERGGEGGRDFPPAMARPSERSDRLPGPGGRR